MVYVSEALVNMKMVLFVCNIFFTYGILHYTIHRTLILYKDTVLQERYFYHFTDSLLTSIPIYSKFLILKSLLSSRDIVFISSINNKFIYLVFLSACISLVTAWILSPANCFLNLNGEKQTIHLKMDFQSGWDQSLSGKYLSFHTNYKMS